MPRGQTALNDKYQWPLLNIYQLQELNIFLFKFDRFPIETDSDSDLSLSSTSMRTAAAAKIMFVFVLTTLKRDSSTAIKI